MPGWGKMDKDEIAKELFGEDAEKVRAKLAKLDAIETELKTSGVTLNKQNELLENLSKTIKDMKVSSPYDSPPPPTVQPQNNQPQYQQDWGIDADAAYKERFAVSAAPIIGTVLDTKASIVKRNAMEQIDKQFHDWHLFNEEIEELAKSANMSQKTQESFWTNCYYVCKGRHAEDIERDRNRKEGKFYLEPAGSSVVLRGDENRDPTLDLTDEQKKVANGLGVPLDIYAKNLKNMSVRG